MIRIWKSSQGLLGLLQGFSENELGKIVSVIIWELYILQVWCHLNKFSSFSACLHFVGKFIIFILSPDVVVQSCSINIAGKQRQSPDLVKLPKNNTSWNDIIIEIFQNFSKYFDCADQPNDKKREAEKLTYINGFTESE